MSHARALSCPQDRGHDAMNFNYDPDQRLKRTEAGIYLKLKYRVGSPAYLAKLAMTGGGPLYQKSRAHTVYLVKDLDDWANGLSATPRKAEKANAEDSK